MKYILFILSICFLGYCETFAQAPANNACASAISLGTVSTTTTTTGTNAAATSDQTSPSCFTYSKNVWYTFTVPAGGGSYNVTINCGTLVNPDAAIFSGTCGAFTEVACNSYCGGSGTTTNVSVNAACLAAGTYYISVDDDKVICSGTAGTFSITVTQTSAGAGASANNACASAVNLGTISTTTTTTGNNNCATADQTSPSCFTYTNNVWYKFTVPAGGGSYNVTVNSNTLQYPDVAVFSGTCGAFTELACNSECGGDFTETISNVSTNANCLAAGTYYISVDDDAATCGGSTGTFSIIVTQVSAGAGVPSNDACTNAINLGTVSTTTTTSGNNLCATADKSSTCVTPAQNVWYKFTIPAGGGSYVISVTGGTIVDPAISVYSGTCAGLTNVNCTYGNTTNASVSASCLTAGTYFINVDDDFGSAGTFSITVTQTIAGTISVNDNCTGATSVVAGNCVNGDVSCATQSQAGCVGTANDDIWYKFVATASSMEINVSASASFDPVVQIFSGACGSLTSLYCDDVDYTTGSSDCKAFTGFTVGTTYYIRVYDYGTGVPATTTFTMCVVSATAASNSCNLNYSYTSIATNIEAGVTNTTPGLADDILSTAIPLGFTFCYDGYQYTQVYISSNAALVFDAIDPCVYPNVYNPRIPASNGAATGYSIAGPIPYSTTADYTPANAILGPWHDIDVANGGTITYAVLGTAPNRRFIVYFNAVHQFESASPCQNAGYEFTGQMKLFETSNNIEIHVQNQKSCTQWNNGQAILGLQNGFGTLAVVPTGYNANASAPYNQYSITNKAWQFTTPCTTCIPIVLPVEIMSFTGVLNDKQVDLKWSTASENNNAYFTIERSTDGKNFVELIRVNGAGNSTQTLNYSTVDNSPLVGVSYYRLSQTDFNGNNTRFNIISINNTDDDGKFTARPNPTEGVVNITYSCDAATIGTLKLYDGNGSLVLSKDITCTSGQNTSQLDLSEITPGIYMITFGTGTKFYHTKLMKR